jgi:hypothetical protein
MWYKEVKNVLTSNEVKNVIQWNEECETSNEVKSNVIQCCENTKYAFTLLLGFI